ncbi:nucleoside-diphosphate-sugar epimerase [Stella humosa]|uniref:Nucleoside-diphosphate-sugar epimerase n=1 Tax=Stella humosa TaxID=94 RepID=A0A3N1M3K6_9PROT|nr:SDR family NAD(P)-dependent oxidoreductase [Stella humosa]ROQ00322.1 nucleoside-diphosphate-sugar epimerase [Stella humosa]BBK30439.1 epimerase [Stella humosa]
MDRARPVAAVTGATGFLGRPLVQALDACGYQVRILARRDPVDARWQDLALEVVPGGLGDAGALARLVSGAAVIVHAAGLVKAGRDQDLFAVNRDGTARLADAVRRHGATARLVLVSSLAARAPHLSAYAASKAAGEAAVIAALPPDQWLILRPTAIYGPGDRELLPFFQIARRGLMPMLGRPEARLTLLHVEDAAAMIASLAGDAPPGRIHALADGRPEGYGWTDVAAAMGAALGRPLRRLPIPVPALALLALGVSAIARATGRPAAMSPAKIREIAHPDWSIGADELPPAGMTIAKTQLTEGFRQTVEWYRVKNLLY